MLCRLHGVVSYPFDVLIDIFSPEKQFKKAQVMPIASGINNQPPDEFGVVAGVRSSLGFLLVSALIRPARETHEVEEQDVNTSYWTEHVIAVLILHVLVERNRFLLLVACCLRSGMRSRARPSA